MSVQLVARVVHHEIEQRFARDQDYGRPRYESSRGRGYSAPMTVDSRAGTLPEPADLVDLDQLLAAYHERQPDPSAAGERVAFGTSGHRGSSLAGTFNEAHVAAISEAVCRYREAEGIDGPLFLGRDTHALSEPAAQTIVEVLAAHGVDVVVDARGGATPTPVISHAILTHNRGGGRGTADGIVVTPSHNPPDDGGFKYNPAHGGPADTDVTGWIEREANALLESGHDGVQRSADPRPRERDYVSAYVDDLPAVIDLELIRESGLRLGVDPLGGASAAYWDAIAERHGLDLEVVTDALDPTFRFVPLDWDGKVRMDSSSPYAMSRLTDMRDRFDVAFANDPDADRHGIVTPGAGLLNPNHHLAACVAYLFGGHRDWGPEVGVGKTLVSSSIIDRVAADLGRRLYEVPVGFKWFVAGLLDGSLGFGGEESAGASFLRRDGTAWSTDKDGLIPCLLAAEMKARTGEDPGEVYAGLAGRFGDAAYRRVDVAASPEEKDRLKRLSPEQVRSSELAGEPIVDKLTTAPGNGAPIGGLKVVAESGWFAARPSGTEDVYKVYAESLQGPEHLERILEEARGIVDEALRG
jgi:phosphoglucomutase